MDGKTARLRERNRRRRNKKSGLNLKFAVDFLYAAAIILIIVGWAVKLPLLYLIAGSAILVGTSYYIYTCVNKIKTSPKKSPEYKDAVAALVFFALMACISVMAIVFGIIEL